MTMAASVMLDQLPHDASQALETAGELEQAKGQSVSQSVVRSFIMSNSP
jgi:hypothetical protein